MLEVIGKGSVTILDPARIETDAYEVKRHRADHGLAASILHSLPCGYRFDLRRAVCCRRCARCTATDARSRLRPRGDRRRRKLIRRIAAEGADDTRPGARAAARGPPAGVEEASE